ncbi:MAG TPA: glycogen debranching protein GlgX [Roseiarcus sp.]|nr:glycogen debranching protein GlgX [Roseiarcus sp.]
MSSSLGAPDPLGVTLEAEGANVAVYSANATAIEFCLFDAKGDTEAARLALPGRSGAIFHGFIAGLKAGARYGLRVHGEFAPERGRRFDSSKLLADPYAFALDRPFMLDRTMFERGADTGAVAPKAVAGANPPGGEPGAARIPWAQTVIYEVNLRGFTRLHPDVPEARRGTFAGLAHPAVIEHFVRLGVTSLEIMPAHAFVDERHLPPLGLANAWGYNPVVLGAPDPRLAPGGWREVRQAVDALHAAGLEAILDVVLNHSGESDELGPTLSMRGLDNASYYRLLPGDASRYVNDTGCGNCLALDREPMLQLSIESLRRWMILGGFDGFRFDLATSLGRRDWGFEASAPLFAAIARDPILGKAKLIAEPWDIGPGGYRLGGFPPGWSEWNDRYRDGARRFWRGDPSMRGEIASRIAGSRDIFVSASAPSKSVNFVTAHDGFTLADLVSYERKHNEANGEGNRDGSNDNCSWNEGVEGATDDPAIKAARTRDMRNLLALLFVSRGAPMLSMGAELGFSQGGNNNAYAQNNATSWLDWRKADTALIDFTRRLIALRRAHAALSRDAFLTGGAFDATGLPDVEWRDADGPLNTGEKWQAPDGNVLVVVFAAPTPGGGTERVAIALNRGRAPADIALPAPRSGMEWTVVLTTAPEAPPATLAPNVRLETPARSTLVLAEAPQRRSARAADPALIDQLAETAGIAGEWWDIERKRTLVSQDAKVALLAAMRLPAATQTQALESLDRLVEERERRALPFAIFGREDEPLTAPLRGDPGGSPGLDAEIRSEDGRIVAFKSQPGEARSIALPDGRTAIERTLALPRLPAGRYELRCAGVSSVITVAPSKAYLPQILRQRLFGAAIQLYAHRRQGDQGIGDFSTLGRIGAAAAAAGAATLGVNPLHALFPQNRERMSPYHPSDRRFLDPIHIDALDGVSLPGDSDFLERALERSREIADLSAAAEVDYSRVWRLKNALLEGRFSAFKKARLAEPGDPLFADYDRFVAEGGEGLRRFACFQAIAEQRQGEDWRTWPDDLRDARGPALVREAERLVDKVDYALFLQWLADRQLAHAAQRARSGGLALGLYRDLAVGAAPDGAEAWAGAGELLGGVSVGAPPDPFSREGQIWHLPAPDPLASAREGWRGHFELYGANMRHAGLLRIDHAMGLTRLFLIPQGARPAEGAYVAYPFRDLVSLIALQSRRRACAIAGEDLGTVPDGFREALAEADILGTSVLWFEREGEEFRPAKSYRALAVACATTHDLPTLAGWWLGADIAERKALGFLSPEEERAQTERRRSEKKALAAAPSAAGLSASAPDPDTALTDETAAALYAFVASSPSILAVARADDLAGETIATNLPGTDRERPNWRRKIAGDVESLFSSSRARAIIAALAAERPAAGPSVASEAQ